MQLTAMAFVVKLNVVKMTESVIVKNVKKMGCSNCDGTHGSFGPDKCGENDGFS